MKDGRKLVYVDGSFDNRLCVVIEGMEPQIVNARQLYNVYATFDVEAYTRRQTEMEWLALIRALETIDPTDSYYILSDAKGIVDVISKVEPDREILTPKCGKEWMRHKRQRVSRILRQRKLDVRFVWVPRELNKAGLVLDGINLDVNAYIEEAQNEG